MPQVLIVDDKEENLYMLQVLLRGHGYQVSAARNGIEALEIARRAVPDLIITDILMPGMDGFSLCREWIADQELQSVPLVFYTATYTDPQDEAFALSLGAARFIRKPTEPDAFVEILREVLENHAAHKLAPLLDAPSQPAEAYYQQYAATLIRKLEDKMAQLEAANRALELDIGERKRAEEALRESEERLRLIADHIGDIVWQIDMGMRFTYVSPAVERVLGYTVDEVLGRDVTTLLDTEGVIQMKQTIQSRLDGAGRAFTGATVYRMKHKDGHWVGVEVISSLMCDPEGHLSGFVGVTRDISERLQAEEALARRASQLALLNRELILLNRVIAATAAAASQGVEPVLQTVCRELALAFEMPQAAAALFDKEKNAAVVVAEYLAPGRPSALGVPLLAVDDPAARYLLTQKMPLVIEGVQTDPGEEAIHRLMSQQGIISLLLLPLLIEGEVVGSLGVHAVESRRFTNKEVDIAWRVAQQASGALARARLEETRQLLNAAVEQAAETVMITDTQDKILYVNPAFERISGYSRDEVLGQSPSFLESGKHDAAFYQHLWETIRAGRVWQGRFINRKKDGSLFAEEATITPVRNRAGKIANYVTVKRDVTRELQLEDQFRQAQKMEAVGRLAGGIAHDFNNLLTVVSLSAQMLERKLHPGDPLSSHVQVIQQAYQRATSLTKQLLTFSRREFIEPQLVDLNQVVGGLDRMVQRLVGEDVELSIYSAQDLWSVWIDPTQVEQVVINLAVNARDAMPDGGKLTIEMLNTVLDEIYAAQHLGVDPGEYVLLTISDNGAGMTEEVMDHLFEPFFTTKERGKGTGLGLATVFGIVKQNGGHIWVYSEVGQGTAFKIYLPRAVDGQPALARRPQPPAAVRGSETLLLVEDDPLVRAMTRDILLGLGYQVLTAGDGVEALQVAEAHPGLIHLLLTDVVLPGMNGRELADRLRSGRPEMRVLYTSGYADSAIVQHGVLAEGMHFVSKPFELEALARQVREALDARG
ncbi:MAG: PAS domain S-box protein [Anaerolineae bacterium]|nr:PAS domain S-box protein [Anaerolineae bacterium]